MHRACPSPAYALISMLFSSSSCASSSTCVVGHGLVEVSAVVVRASQVAVGARLLALVAEALGDAQVLFVALHGIIEVTHGDVDGSHVAQLPSLGELILGLFGQQDALLVAGQGVGIVADGRVHVTQAAEGWKPPMKKNEKMCKSLNIRHYTRK